MAGFRTSARIAAVAAGVFVGVAAGAASAAEIKLLYPTALEPVFRELLPAFEKASGHEVVAQYGPAGRIAERIRKGEPADVAIVTSAQSEALVREGKAVAGSNVSLARVGVGVYVQKGAARPDISSVEAFKQALRSVKSIGMIDPATGGASGIFMAALLDRLGLAAELRSRIRLFPPGSPIFAAVAKGEIELAFGQISEILSRPSVDLVGPLPAEIQGYTHFAAIVVSGARNAEAAAALVSFVATAAAKAAMRAKGFEP